MMRKKSYLKYEGVHEAVVKLPLMGATVWSPLDYAFVQNAVELDHCMLNN